MKQLIGLAMVACLLGGCAVEVAEVGSKAPDAKLEPLDKMGGSASIRDTKGVRVIDFWATWCGPCRQSMPFIQKIHDSYAAKGVSVMGISNEARPAVEQFHKESGYTYPIYLDLYNDANRRYKILAIPTLVVIGKDDVIKFIGSPFDAAQVTQAIDRAVAEN